MITAIYSVLITLYALSALLTVKSVGKERKPLTENQAVAIVAIDGLLIAAIVYVMVSGR